MSWTITPRFTQWTPADISTALWLDAADATTITESGGSISQWNDKSGNSRHAIQATSGNRPTVLTGTLNSKNVIAFNGSSQWFSNISSYTGQCFIAVAQSSQSKSFAGLHSAVGAQSELILNASGTGVAGGTVNGTAGSSITFQQPFIWVYQLSSPLATTRTLGQEPTLLGATRAWVGYCAELISISTSISVLTRQKVEGYLAHKWGLTANLPADHPYKVNAPAP
jgi:hypothetical protein